MKLESLEDRRQGIELVAVQRVAAGPEEPVVQLATVFVPDGSLKHFFNRFEQYERERTKKDEPRHKDMVGILPCQSSTADLWAPNHPIEAPWTPNHALSGATTAGRTPRFP
jgi:hypothetical protein